MAQKHQTRFDRDGQQNAPSEDVPKFLFNSPDDVKKYKREIVQWVTNEADKSMVDFAHDFGEYIAQKKLTTSQIRAVFGEMRRIQMSEFSQQTKTDFILLKPKLAYAVRRHKVDGLNAFYELFKIAYQLVDTTNVESGKLQFRNLMILMEAILAYHKYHNKNEYF